MKQGWVCYWREYRERPMLEMSRDQPQSHPSTTCLFLTHYPQPSVSRLTSVAFKFRTTTLIDLGQYFGTSNSVTFGSHLRKEKDLSGKLENDSFAEGEDHSLFEAGAFQDWKIRAGRFGRSKYT